MRSSLLLFWCLQALALTSTSVRGQDREVLTHICDTYAANNQTIRVGVLDKGDTGFPMSAWGGVFGTIATDFLSRFGCTTSMQLYSIAAMPAAVAANKMDFIFTNPLAGAQFQVQYGATPLVSMTMQYQAKSDRLPYPGKTAALDRFGALMMYANANMTKDGTTNGTVPLWLQQRRALIQQYNAQTWDDVVALPSKFPKKNLTMCALSVTSLGGYAMASYEFFKRNKVMSQLYTMNYVGSHAACIQNLLLGKCDLATLRTGALEQWVNDSRIDPGTFTVINNNPTPFFPLYISTQLYPEWPVLAMPYVDEALVKSFTVPLTAMAIITNSAEAIAVSGAYFSYPFSYNVIRDMMFQLNTIGTGQCDTGYARQNYSATPVVVDPNVPQGCFPCTPGTFIVVANGTSTCTPCPLNTYSLIPTTANCNVCANDGVTHSVGSTTCVAPTKAIKEISDATSYAMVSVCVVCLVFLSIAFYGVIHYRSHQVMKASSPTFLLLVLVGIGTLCASIIPRALENQDLGIDDREREGDLPINTCLADIYLTNIGYTLMTASLLVKTWRLHTIFSSMQLQGRTVITDTLLLGVVAAFMIIQVVILLALTESAKMGMYIKSLDSKYDYFACSLPEDSPHTLLSLYLPVVMVPRFALLIGTTIAAFLVRNLPASFNESTQLLSAMYNLVFFSVLLPAIDAAVGRGTNTGVIAYSISVMLICLLTAAILFIPKFLLIMVRVEKPNGKAVEANSKLSSSMCVDTGSGSNRTGSNKTPVKPNTTPLATNTMTTGTTGTTGTGSSVGKIILTQPTSPIGSFGMIGNGSPGRKISTASASPVIPGRRSSAGSSPLNITVPLAARASISAGRTVSTGRKIVRKASESGESSPRPYPQALSPANHARRSSGGQDGVDVSAPHTPRTPITPAPDVSVNGGELDATTIQLQVYAVESAHAEAASTPPLTPSVMM